MPSTSKTVFVNENESIFKTSVNKKIKSPTKNIQNKIICNKSNFFSFKDTDFLVPTLVQMTAKLVAQNFSFETLEYIYQTFNPNKHLPNDIFLTILKHCFPKNEEDIRLYRYFFFVF